MRIFKGLENLNSVIDQHVSEWRIEQGEEPEKVSLEEAVRRRLTAQPSEGSGRFSADRFLETKPKSSPKNEPEAVEIIKSKDDRHSWLYNEVMKAVKDASKGGKTKVVAIFVPVIQNGKEFEELPVDETVTLSPIDEDLTKVETLPVVEEISEPEAESEEFDLLPAEQAEPDPELAEAFKEMEEKLDEQILEKRQQEEQEQIEEVESEPEEEVQEEQEEVVEPEPEVVVLEEESEPEHEEPVELKLETEPEVVPEVLVETEEEVPEVQEKEPEVQEVQQEEIEVPEEFEVTELTEVPEEIEEITEVKEPEHEEFSLPEILDDDDVFEDDTVIEEPDETVIIENTDEDSGEGEIEIIQD